VLVLSTEEAFRTFTNIYLSAAGDICEGIAWGRVTQDFGGHQIFDAKYGDQSERFRQEDSLYSRCFSSWWDGEWYIDGLLVFRPSLPAFLHEAVI
jgi:hypothetical protein